MKAMRRLGVGLAVIVAVAVPSTSATPAIAAPPTTVSATGVFDAAQGGVCPQRDGYDSYLPIVMTGDLDGCWYTHTDATWDLGTPTGLYFEAGRELFVGTVHTAKGSSTGSFKATYFLQSQYAPEFSSGYEVWGRCQHRITPGSGRGELRNISGRLEFTDVVLDGALVRFDVAGSLR